MLFYCIFMARLVGAAEKPNVHISHWDHGDKTAASVYVIGGLLRQAEFTASLWSCYLQFANETKYSSFSEIMCIYHSNRHGWV